MIKIERLAFSNIFSYGQDNVVDVESGVTQIVGQNGAGKSSIPTILEELFYNKNSRGIKKADLSNRYTDVDGYELSSMFYVDSDKYTVTKVVKSTTKLFLVKNDEDISGHTTTQTYKLLEQILGLDFTTFTKLVYQSMDSSLDFLNATDANRKKFLVSLLGLENYIDAESSLKEAVKESKIEVSSAEAAFNTTAGWIKKHKDIGESEELVEVSKIDDTLDESILQLTAELKNIDLHNSEAQRNINARKLYERVLSEEVPLVEYDSDGYDEYRELVQSLTNKITVAKTELRGLSKDLKDTKAIETRCRTCGHELDVEDTTQMVEDLEAQINHANSCINSHESELYNAKSSLSDIEHDRSQAAKYYAWVSSMTTAIKAYDPEANQEVKNASDVERQLRQLKTDKASQLSKQQKEIAENRRIESSNAKIVAVKEQMSDMLSENKAQLTGLEDVKVKHARLVSLATSMGSKGLIAYKIESVVKVFENLINEYLQVFSDGEFALTFSVEDAKLALKLYKHSVNVDIKSLSSGERNKVNTATLLAVRKMMTSISKIDINVLFLDEVVSVLDEQSKDTLISVLLKEPLLASFVVSHGYTHPLAETINVSKTDNVSEIE